MIARHEAQREQTTDVWAKLAAPLPPGVTAWRQDGRPVMRDGRFFARFVSYIDANTVRERLDSVVPGEWNLTLELMPPIEGDDESLPGQNRCAFKARLQILGVVREDVGTGKDYKQASTDAFKRVAVRFGIGHELYAMGVNWVAMDGDGKYAKPLEDPQAAHDRRQARASDASAAAPTGTGDEGEAAPASEPQGEEQPALKFKRAPIASDVPPCPKCGGRMWDNRLGKRNPKAPDFKCRDRNCDGVIWPPKPGTRAAKGDADAPAAPAAPEAEPATLGSDEIPF
ncbi:MAG TPA: Rad52/Rad22 family DNA repair protein [Gemmatimonadaceae bacterium]|nr:Rad52/Rad22 family DNA repair protein [Gemmatimonadaceae bacterium]